MSSFLMSHYPQIQGSMGAAYEPKFPPSETDFHHLHHHHHTGYGAMNGITANHMDYSYHNHNGYNYGNYTPTPSHTHSFYHHPHPPYGGTPQMHPTTNSTAPSPHQTTTNSSSSSTQSPYSNNNSIVSNNRNNSVAAVPVQSAVVNNGLNISENSPNVDTTNIGYYNNYYATNTNGHHPHNPQDLPLQCPSSEPPANTALGLQELGKSCYMKNILLASVFFFLHS